jgi:hypothetical protein
MLGTKPGYEKVGSKQALDYPTMSSDKKNRTWRGRPTQTCDTCKAKHQKCDSRRPTCHQCALRNVQCTYSSTPAHRVDLVAIQRKDSTASGAVGSLSPCSSNNKPRDASAHRYTVVHEILMAGLVCINIALICISVTEMIPRVSRV